MRKVRTDKGTVLGERRERSGDWAEAYARPFPPSYVFHNFPLFLPLVIHPLQRTLNSSSFSGGMSPHVAPIAASSVSTLMKPRQKAVYLLNPPPDALQ
jgi:hypothetical protein